MTRLTVSFLLLTLWHVDVSAATPVDVYLFGGQSNMQGLGAVSDLTAAESAPQAGVSFWNSTTFETMDPGTTVLSSDLMHFGPELGFARRMREKDASREVYIVKYWASGRALDSGWDNQTWVGDPTGPGRDTFYPGTSETDPNRGTQYIAMLTRFKAGIAHLDGQGIDYEIKGFAWMQGEQDSKNGTSATRYAESLQRLTDRLHEDLGLSGDPLPLVYGQVLSKDDPPPARFTHRTEIRQSQANADADSGHAESISNAHLVSTDGLSLVDDVHWDAAGQLTLGQRMADAMLAAANENAAEIPEPSSCALAILSLSSLGLVYRRRAR
ncbi:MAG: sialate O-acetylesterase [Pirellulales bacterium]|nr:sialate O-acetylesterase [Pirellulales bacterium]